VADVTDAQACSHRDEIRDVASSAEGCEDCLASGTEWLHLRMCLRCGRVGCCDQSPRRHARAHARATKHPIVRSFEPGEDWVYCYPDRLYLEPATDG
jgi:uncharacterized UBP type Zn finger protein